ncbi:unnamed protein product [Agarophyton chilense]
MESNRSGIVNHISNFISDAIDPASAVTGSATNDGLSLMVKAESDDAQLPDVDEDKLQLEMMLAKVLNHSDISDKAIFN